MPTLTETQRLTLKFWFPPLLTGGLAWLLLYFLGDTPLSRASGLALVIVGITSALRRFGAIVSTIGGLTLTLSPAFWSQTGGAEGNPSTIVIAFGVGIGTLLLMLIISNRPYVGIGLGVIAFAVLFSSQIGTPRSLRLTSFVVGWLMFLITDMLLRTNPHPQDAPQILLDKDNPNAIRPYHTWGILMLFGIGTLNDPVLTFFAPALALAIFLTRVRLPIWYWAVLILLTVIGIRGFVIDYIEAQSYLMVTEQWRNASRWISMVRLVIAQFSPFGILLGVLGLARLARWYPPLGIVTMLAYAFYMFFGLIYLGSRREILLLPLLLIQVVWMTYGAFTISQWVAKAFPHWRIAPYLAQLAYGIFPVFLLITLLQP